MALGLCSGGKTMDADAPNESIGGFAFNRLNRRGLIIRQQEPKNLEFPFDRLDSYLTPVDSFYSYVVHHTLPLEVIVG